MSMPDSVTRKHRTMLVSRRIALPLETILIVTGVVGLAITAPNVGFWMLVVWMTVAVGYMVVAFRRLTLAAKSPEQNRIQLPNNDLHSGTWGKSFHFDVIVISFASMMGVFSAVLVSRNANDAMYSQLSRLVAAIAIVLAWALLQVGFSRLYADIWYQKENGGGLDFPKTEQPGLVEFTFFAFGIGTAFQNSDTKVTTSYMRMVMMMHSVIAFLYATLLLAFIVSLIPGSS